MNIPPGATAKIEGFYYKIGIHGIPFRWSRNEWKRSTINPARIINGNLRD